MRYLSFPKDANPKQKIIISSLYIIVVLTLLPIFLDVLIEENIVFYLSRLSIAISITIIFLTVRGMLNAALNRNSKLHYRIKNNWKKEVLIIFPAMFIIPLLFYASVSIGFLYVLHIFLQSNEERVNVTIDSKQSGYYAPGCAGGVYIDEHKHFLNNMVCGIESKDWKSLAPGDKICLIGKKTCVGFSYNKYEIITARK